MAPLSPALLVSLLANVVMLAVTLRATATSSAPPSGATSYAHCATGALAAALPATAYNRSAAVLRRPSDSGSPSAATTATATQSAAATVTPSLSHTPPPSATASPSAAAPAGGGAPPCMMAQPAWDSELARRKALGFGHGQAFMSGEYFAFDECTRGHGRRPWVAANEVFFVVMGTNAKRSMSRAIAQTWATDFPRDRLLFVTDVPDAEIGSVSLPLPGGDDGTYRAAQHRSLQGLLVAVRNRTADVRWIILVDDDTFEFRENLLAALSAYNDLLPVLTSFYVDGLTFLPQAEFAFPAGGAGMAMTVPAAEMMAAELYGTRCPYRNANDLTLAGCQRELGIPMVHNAAFNTDEEIVPKSLRLAVRPLRTGHATYHHISEEHIRQMWADKREGMGLPKP